MSSVFSPYENLTYFPCRDTQFQRERRVGWNAACYDLPSHLRGTSNPDTIFASLFTLYSWIARLLGRSWSDVPRSAPTAPRINF